MRSDAFPRGNASGPLRVVRTVRVSFTLLDRVKPTDMEELEESWRSDASFTKHRSERVRSNLPVGQHLVKEPTAPNGTQRYSSDYNPQVGSVVAGQGPVPRFL